MVKNMMLKKSRKAVSPIIATVLHEPFGARVAMRWNDVVADLQVAVLRIVASDFSRVHKFAHDLSVCSKPMVFQLADLGIHVIPGMQYHRCLAVPMFVLRSDEAGKPHLIDDSRLVQAEDVTFVDPAPVQFF